MIRVFGGALFHLGKPKDMYEDFERFLDVKEAATQSMRVWTAKNIYLFICLDIAQSGRITSLLMRIYWGREIWVLFLDAG